MRKAFTMVELVFIIVVLGILAAVAFPKMTAALSVANEGKGRDNVVAIRSAIILNRQNAVLQGKTNFISNLDDAIQNTVGETLFDGNSTLGRLLTTTIKSSNSAGGWMKIGAKKYRYYVDSSTHVDFDYYDTNGTFDCGTSDDCKRLTQ